MGSEGSELEPELRSWPPPQGGYERILKPDPRSARRAMRPWEIAFSRVFLVLMPALGAGILAAGPPAPSLWHYAGIGCVISDGSTLLGWLFTPKGRLWLLQLVGVRPPARRVRDRA